MVGGKCRHQLKGEAIRNGQLDDEDQRERCVGAPSVLGGRWATSWAGTETSNSTSRSLARAAAVQRREGWEVACRGTRGTPRAYYRENFVSLLWLWWEEEATQKTYKPN